MNQPRKRVSASCRRYFKRLLEKTSGNCCLCGRKIKNILIVTREHLIPASEGGKQVDILAAHYRCNAFRSNMSLVRTMTLLSLSISRNKLEFDMWANGRLKFETGRDKSIDPPNVHWRELKRVHGNLGRYQKLKKKEKRLLERTQVNNVESKNVQQLNFQFEH